MTSGVRVNVQVLGLPRGYVMPTHEKLMRITRCIELAATT